SLTGWANYFRHGVSKAVFNAIDHYTWNRLARWIRAKYAGKSGLSKKQLRHRFCDIGWRFAHNGVAFTGASSVSVVRYRCCTSCPRPAPGVRADPAPAAPGWAPLPTWQPT